MTIGKLKFELKFELINTQSWFINPIYIIVVSIPFQFIYNIIKDKLIGVAGSLELLLLVTLTLLFHMHIFDYKISDIFMRKNIRNVLRVP